MQKLPCIFCLHLPFFFAQKSLFVRAWTILVSINFLFLLWRQCENAKLKTLIINSYYVYGYIYEFIEHQKFTRSNSIFQFSSKRECSILWIDIKFWFESNFLQKKILFLRTRVNGPWEGLPSRLITGYWCLKCLYLLGL